MNKDNKKCGIENNVNFVVFPMNFVTEILFAPDNEYFKYFLVQILKNICLFKN